MRMRVWREGEWDEDSLAGHDIITSGDYRQHSVASTRILALPIRLQRSHDHR